MLYSSESSCEDEVLPGIAAPPSLPSLPAEPNEPNDCVANNAFTSQDEPKLQSRVTANDVLTFEEGSDYPSASTPKKETVNSNNNSSFSSNSSGKSFIFK